jgi:hypothetical protein
LLTVIRTSTTLVVSGLLHAHGLPEIGIFETTRICLPVAVASLALLVVLSPVLLRERRAPRRDLAEGGHEFVVSMRVAPGGPLDDKAVEEGGLGHGQGIFLVETERARETIARGGAWWRSSAEDLRRIEPRDREAVDPASYEALARGDPRMLQLAGDEFVGLIWVTSVQLVPLVGDLLQTSGGSTAIATTPPPSGVEPASSRYASSSFGR